jgi:GntR family transcriptional regulator/MocR family aminotransferase
MLLDGCRTRLAGRMRVEATSSGLQTLAWLPDGTDDREFARRAHEVGVEVAPLSRFALQTARPAALLLGFGGFDARAIEAGVAALASLVRSSEPAYASTRRRCTDSRR